MVKSFGGMQELCTWCCSPEERLAAELALEVFQSFQSCERRGYKRREEVIREEKRLYENRSGYRRREEVIRGEEGYKRREEVIRDDKRL